MEPKSPVLSKKEKKPFTSPIIEKISQKKAQAKILLSQLVDKLDTYTYARSTFLLVLIFYLLGKSLNYFLYLILILYLYLFAFRFIRFWVKNSLMYMLDFIYFGNVCLVIFLLFYNQNVNYFLTVYSCATGVISLTIIVDNNEVELGDTDFITSTFLDSVPVLVTWAIRWKHILYREKDSSFVLDIGNVYFEFDSIMAKLIYLPVIIWFAWAAGYLMLNGKILRKFAYSNLYESTICKFYHTNYLSFILGDHKKLTIVKYLTLQLLFLLISIPVVLSCFYNFYFSSGYLIFIIIFLGFNSAKGKEKRLNQLVNENKDK